MDESRLIRVLRERGYLDEKGLERAKEWQKSAGEGMPLSQVLVRLGIVREDDLAKAVAEAEAVRVVEKIEDSALDYEAMMMLDDDFLRKHNIVLIRGEMGRSEVAHWQSVPFEVLEQVQFLTNRVVEPVVAPRREVTAALERYLSLGELEKRERLLAAKREDMSMERRAPTVGAPRQPAFAVTASKKSLLLTLVELLVRKGVLSEEEIAAALGEALRKKGVISDSDFAPSTGE